MANTNQYLRTRDAAEYCGLAPKTLEKLRYSGGGPQYIRPAGRRFVVYERVDLDDWLQDGRRRTTQDVEAEIALRHCIA